MGPYPCEIRTIARQLSSPSGHCIAPERKGRSFVSDKMSGIGVQKILYKIGNIFSKGHVEPKFPGFETVCDFLDHQGVAGIAGRYDHGVIVQCDGKPQV